MPATVSSDPQSQHGVNDDLDDLFADIIGNNTTNHVGQNKERANHEPNDIDEEIKVTKQRKPVAKLDENRLLSAAGIPKLRRISKDKLRFNGRGNEFTDMARLLNTYQLWLDDMFPKAKFIDGLAMIEKLGHKKKIQMYRKEWIDEGKPKSSNYEDGLDDFLANRESQPSDRLPWEAEAQAPPQSQDASEVRGNGIHNGSMAEALSTEQQEPAEDNEPDEDELDALLEEAGVQMTANTSIPQEEQHGLRGDELDILLAGDPQTADREKSLFGGPTAPHDNFDDDEEAMAGMDW